jgi:hypothetical protein
MALQQIARRVARPPRRLRLDPRKPRRRKLQGVDKGVDESDRILSATWSSTALGIRRRCSRANHEM